MPEAGKKISVEEFLSLAGSVPLVDVRSPAEYNNGHIPGSVNVYLFDDKQRETVGTIYKQKGSQKAVMAGIDLAAPEMSVKLQDALKLAADGRLLVHCWRGGMRSEAMAWLFSLAGITPYILEGGYKAYRNYILEDIGKERKFIILGGLTGTGKTHILRHLASEGSQVTDLEELACHKGSAFGAMGQPPQPSSEHFANLLYGDLKEKKNDEAIWLEDESHNIGTVFIPDNFFSLMQESKVIALMMSIETRLPRLVQEYTFYPKEQIIASLTKISRRLGGDRVKAALGAIEKDDYAAAIRITLEYYDKAYCYGLSKRKEGQVLFVETDTDDIVLNARKILDAAASIK